MIRSTVRCCLAPKKSQISSGSPKVSNLLQPAPTNLTTGIILSGSPYSVYADDAPHVDPAVFEAGVPILGICYGLQEIARSHGGNVEAHTHREYGYAKITVEKAGNHGDKLFEGITMEEDGGLQVSDLVHILRDADSGMDEPRRSIIIAPSWFQHHCFDSHFALHRYCARAKTNLWCPVPPGSFAQSKREGGHRGVCPEYLWS